MNGTLVADDVARARALGITLTLDIRMDRAPADQPATRDPRGRSACPTCDDGLLTITHPTRCRACVAEGL